MAMLAGCSSGGAGASGDAGTSQAEVVTSTKQEKCRTVITTDGEVDDRDSVIRALLYANEMDIAGIVLTSSMYHYAGDGADVDPFRWTGTPGAQGFQIRYLKAGMKPEAEFLTGEKVLAAYEYCNLHGLWKGTV